MPKFARKDIHISVSGKPVEVEVICGFAQHVRYKAELFDDQGNDPQTVSIGSTLQTDPPPFAINATPRQLIGRFLVITADIFNMGTTENFQVDAVFRQDGQELDRITVADTFKDNVSVSLVARFQ